MKVFKPLRLAACMLAISSAPLFAQDTTSFVVGYAPGGGNDLAARIVAEALTKAGKGTYIIENKPGAGGRLAAELVSKARPGSKTYLATGNSAVSMAAAIYSDLAYDPVNDLVPVAVIADYPQLVMIVKNDHPAKTFAEYVEWSKANADKSNYAAVAPAYTIPTEQLKLDSNMVAQAISYKSSAEGLAGVLNGEISFLLGDHNTTLPSVEGGQTRALLVTGSDRIEQLPDTPSAGELGYSKVQSSLWTGIFAPKGTTPDQAGEMAALISEALQSREAVHKLQGIGVSPGTLVTDAFAEQIAKEVSEIKEVVTAAGLVFE